MATDCLHERFAGHARSAPDLIALSTPAGPMSYGELDQRSDRLAGTLVGLGVRPGVLVGLCAPRSPEAIVAMLGILKAGGAYVAVDPRYPAARIDYLLADSAVRIVVAAAGTRDLLSGRPVTVVRVDGDRVGVEPGADPSAPSDPWTAPTGTDLAYVVYTSGSTGRPKGVAVEHRNVTRLFDKTQPWFRFDQHDTWSLFHSISFDFSVWEIWGALAHGGRLVLLPETVSRSPGQLVALLRAEQVTVLNQTPAAFHQLQTGLFTGLADAATTGDLALRLIVFGGERLDPRMLAPWVERHGDQRPELINMYGISETTVHCTYRRITAADVAGDDGTSPIGIPLPDLRVYLLDDHGEPVPEGTPGEIYVAGDGVARGYLHRPDLTAERFGPAGHGVPERRLYRSGDRALRRPDGDLIYLGRLDDQLKVRGYRIEPAEIEECLTRVPGVAGVVAVAREVGVGDVRLVAFLLPAHPGDPGDPESSALIAAAESHARTELPRHLRPARYTVVSEFPTTLHGKVNRNALSK